LTDLFRWTGKRHPSQLTEADLLGWCTCRNPANNTVYQRTSKARTTRLSTCGATRRCGRSGASDADPATTMKSFPEPMDTEMLDRAAGVLD
jgi:hypothetical protein